MATTYILYNPLSGNGTGMETAKTAAVSWSEGEIVWKNMTDMERYVDFFGGLDPEDRVILCGGDGTLNRFASEIEDLRIERELYYYPTGTGNDFWNDVKPSEQKPMAVGRYLRGLPKVTVKGKEYRFLNGVGYGIDGYCCEEGDRLRATSDKPVNYTGIAIKGLLFHFKPRCAKVTVDGKSYEFKKTWIAPVMHGRFYGGGMMMAPDQVWNNEDGTLSLVMFHGTGKLKTLMIFPSIFKGEHVKHTKHITVLTGKEFEVAFDRPTPLQVDGETILDVESYHVSATVSVSEEAKAVVE